MDELLLQRRLRIRSRGGEEGFRETRSGRAFEIVARGVCRDRQLGFRHARSELEIARAEDRLQDRRSRPSRARGREWSQRRPKFVSHARSDGERARAETIRWSYRQVFPRVILSGAKDLT